MHTPHVTHLVISLAHGGLERLVVDWANARNTLHPGSTAVCCLDAAGELAGQVKGGRVSVIGAQRERMPWDISAVRRIREAALQQEGRAILHSHNMAAQHYAALAVAGRRRRLAHVFTQHGPNPHNRGAKNRLRARILAWLTDRMVAVSESTAMAMRLESGVSRERIRVVPNGVAPHTRGSDGGRLDLRKSQGIPADAFVIGSVGRLDPVKGYDRMFRALPAVMQAHPFARLLLVGDGPARADLQAQAASVGLADRVVFAGYQADARRWLDAMDLFVLPSRSEGLSVALLEAMSAGVPVMATAVGESSAVMAGGTAGVILPEEEASWTALFDDVVRSRARDLADRVRQASRRVAEVYALERTVAAYDRVYAELADARGRGDAGP